MASEKTNPELDALAERIFCEAVVSAPAKRNGEELAAYAYSRASEFLKVQQRVRSGGLQTEKSSGPRLANCCAPNLPKRHPHNLVSAKLGDINLVQKLNTWLSANPTPETDPEELLPRLRRDFPELGWGLAEINTARSIFPAFCVKS
jgi:hypothetical protein